MFKIVYRMNFVLMESQVEYIPMNFQLINGQTVSLLLWKSHTETVELETVLLTMITLF